MNNKSDTLKAAANALASAADLLLESAKTLDEFDVRISGLEHQLLKEQDFKHKLIATIQEYIN